jgi:hypothetical protein
MRSKDFQVRVIERMKLQLVWLICHGKSLLQKHFSLVYFPENRCVARKVILNGVEELEPLGTWKEAFSMLGRFAPRNERRVNAATSQTYRQAASPSSGERKRGDFGTFPTSSSFYLSLLPRRLFE